jgi:hypothetical protein
MPNNFLFVLHIRWKYKEKIIKVAYVRATEKSRCISCSLHCSEFHKLNQICPQEGFVRVVIGRTQRRPALTLWLPIHVACNSRQFIELRKGLPEPGGNGWYFWIWGLGGGEGSCYVFLSYDTVWTGTWTSIFRKKFNCLCVLPDSSNIDFCKTLATTYKATSLNYPENENMNWILLTASVLKLRL